MQILNRKCISLTNRMKQIQPDRAGINKQHHKVPWIFVRLEINARRVPGRQNRSVVACLLFC